MRLPAPIATDLAAAAGRERIVLVPGPSFSVDGTFEHHVRIPFTLPPETIDDAVGKLAGIAARLGAGPAPAELSVVAV